MATARAVATMAIFLLIALSSSHMASSLRLGVCRSSRQRLPPRSGNCEKSNDPDCCEDGKMYYRCSPPVTAIEHQGRADAQQLREGQGRWRPVRVRQRLPQRRGEGGGALHGVVQQHGALRPRRIKISANGNFVYAKVVDECDSLHGCDEEHNFEPPCDLSTSSTRRRRSGTPWGHHL
ncbi:LOW QUALITY PROTEIN: hypothetical protein U9M48_000304, partial [Paspalum notatum var. saurae]